MNMRLPAAAPLLAGLILLTCAGCATSGSPKLQVALPDNCEALARPVAVPGVKAGDDARLAAARHRAALVHANARLAAARDCQAMVRARYARGR